MSRLKDLFKKSANVQTQEVQGEEQGQEPFADGTLGAAMKAAQHSCIDRRATDRLCDFIEDQYAEM